MAYLPRKLQKIFGLNAGANQIGRFGSLVAGSPTAFTGAAADPEDLQSLPNYLGGWFSGIVGNSNPAIQDMNSLFFLITYQLAYLFQKGVPEWNNATEYYEGSVANNGQGKLYRSLQNTNTNHVLTDPSWWIETGGAGGLVNEALIDLQTCYGGKLYQANTNASTFFVNLTTGFAGGQMVILDTAGNAQTNNITIIPAVGQKLNGVTNGSLVINKARSGYWISWDVANSSWQAIAIGASGSGAGGLAPVAVSTTVATAATNTMYLANTTSAAFTITLPGGTSEAVVGVLDALETFGTNKLTVAPSSGQYIATGLINEALELDFNRANAVFYRAPGTSVWRIQYQLAGIGGSGGGGLTPVAVSANGTCVVNTLEDVNVTAGTITRTLPNLPTSGQPSVSIRILDSERVASPTNKIVCAPATGQAFATLAANATLDINYAGGWIEFNAVGGATSWKITTQATTTVQPASALGRVKVQGSNAYGSTNTMIRRFSNILESSGSDITYADSATLGASFTINSDGVYAIIYNDLFSVASIVGLSVNTNQPTVNIVSITTANRLIVAPAPGVSILGFVSYSYFFKAGDVIRAHTDGASSAANVTLSSFTIQKLAN